MAKKKYCPFSGFHGSFCPHTPKEDLSLFTSTEKIIENEQKLLPIGVGISFDITSGDLKLPLVNFTYSDNENYWVDPFTTDK